MVKNLAEEIIGNRYLLREKLGSGGMGAVYRATDRLSGEDVALKRVTTPEDRLEFASRPGINDPRLALAQEFRTLASLRHPRIISVLDYGFDPGGNPFFTMDLIEGGTTFLKAGRGQPLETQVQLLIQVLQALSYLHRHGLLHRDLKPTNVLVVEGEVKVLDFGLSVVGASTTSVVDTVAGTIAYLAPEIFQDKPASRESDLYAVGVMAYELLAGHYPFDMGNMASLVADIIHSAPDLSALNGNQQVEQVVGKLLSKTRAERYSDANEVIRDLCAATGVPVPPETDEIRESFLQAARFVGRTAELEQLEEVLQRAIDGRGSAWLISGESGIGKSRVLDEMRTRALVGGAAVLRGQAVAEAGSPYHVWRDIVRWLALLTELSDWEAGVLKILVPDIGELLGRSIPEAPGLDPQAARDRLLAVIEDLFYRYRKPTVLILEDLHWAQESLLVLERLIRAAPQLPLLIIGSYRSGETPGLPSNFPEMKVLELSRFADEETAELSAAMLGEAGLSPQIVEFLQRETEGNAFFLVEVVRALAEEAGQLEQVGHLALPEKVVPRGIQEIVQRRLNRVPMAARPILQYAAVAGRRLDLDVLRILTPEVNLERRLVAIADAGVISFEEEHWRFAHDKLREAVLDDLEAESKEYLHAKVAQALEQVYGEAPEQLASLAHHWGLAGDQGRERHFAELAGEQALAHGAYQDAAALLGRALGLLDPRTSQPMQIARLERQLGQASYGLGDLPATRQHLRRAVAILGWPVPSSSPRLAIGLIGQILRQVFHRLRPGGPARAPRPRYLEAAGAYNSLAELAVFTNETVLAINAVMRSLNLAESGGASPELATAYAGAAFTAALATVHRLADGYSRRARETARSLGDPPTIGYVLFVTGTYEQFLARWEAGQKAMAEAVEIFDRVGDQARWAAASVIQAHRHYFQGRFAESAAVWERVYESALRRNHLQHICWALSWKAALQIRMHPADELGEAIRLTEQATELLAQTIARSDEIVNYGVQCMAHLHRGEPQSAYDVARQASGLISESPPSAPANFLGYAGAAEVYLTLWESTREASGPENRDLIEAARQAVKDLHSYARVFHLGKPRAYVWQGLLEWLSGNQRKANSSWIRAVSLSRSMQMPYDEALARYMIGRHSEGPDAARQLARAIDLLEQMQVPYDLQLAQLALERKG